MIEKNLKEKQKKRTVHIIKKCPQCKKEFSRPPSLARTKFCSKKCYNETQRTSERRDIECQKCHVIFNTTMDHGVWPKYCGRDCFKTAKYGVRIQECPTCLNEFKSYFKTDTRKYHIYCSIKCLKDSPKKGVILQCSNCDIDFFRSDAKIRQNNTDKPCCSTKCAGEIKRGENNNNYKGGSYISESGYVFLHINGEWRSEHRVVVEDLIKRRLNYFSEPILHINGVNTDNTPENLYICSDFSEMGYILNSYDVPYPVQSNINTLIK